MLTMMFILAGVSSFLELVIITIIPPLKKLYNWTPKGQPVGMAINLAGSMLLSYFVGAAFGAGGLIAMGSGLTSTAMTVLFLRLEQFAKSRGHNSVKGEINDARTRLHAFWEEYGQMFRDLWKVILITIRIITWPLRKYRTTREWIIKTRERFAH